MNRVQKARQLYDLHNGSRVDIITALVRDEGMTWEGAKTYYQQVAGDVYWENYKRRHRWDFLKNPYTYLLVLGVLLIVLGR